jgi:hypothetical protein
MESRLILFKEIGFGISLNNQSNDSRHALTFEEGKMGKKDFSFLK